MRPWDVDIFASLVLSNEHNHVKSVVSNLRKQHTWWKGHFKFKISHFNFKEANILRLKALSCLNEGNQQGDKKNLSTSQLTRVAVYLLDFHRSPGTLGSSDKNHIHLLLEAKQQTPLWMTERHPIHTDIGKKTKIKHC